MDVFGLGGPFSDLKRRDATDEEKKRTVARFLVRRVTTATVNGRELTKNQYRREWRQGGVLQYDYPITVADPKKRLVVALVQKKVAELLGSGRFTMSFQIGMLASFESFLQTARLRNDDEDTIFDDAEQQRDLLDVEKNGIDELVIEQDSHGTDLMAEHVAAGTAPDADEGHGLKDVGRERHPSQAHFEIFHYFSC